MTAVKKHAISRRRILPVAVFAASIALAACMVHGDEVYTKNKRGNELFKKKQYEEALKQYDDALLLAPSDTLLKMNKGSALYRLGRVEEADSAYRSALGIANKKKRADAQYNMGNVLFREGDKLAMGGGQGAMDKYKEALQHYINTLDLRPEDKDAKWNLELAQRRIKLQEQQQQQNKNQDKNNQDKKQDKQDKNNQDNQDKKQDNQDKNRQNQDQKQDQQDKKNEQDKQNQNAKNDDKQQQQPPQPQPQQGKDDVKKEEAKRLIAQFADDADSLNKPPEKKGIGVRMHKPEKDW